MLDQRRRRWTNIEPQQRRRRWTNIEPTTGQFIVFAGKYGQRYDLNTESLGRDAVLTLLPVPLEVMNHSSRSISYFQTDVSSLSTRNDSMLTPKALKYYV